MPAAAAVGEGELGRRTWRTPWWLFISAAIWDAGQLIGLRGGAFFLTLLGGLKGAEMADAGT